MTVSSQKTIKSANGDGSNVTFPYDFKIFADADLTVILRSAAGTETVQTLTTHYSVTNAGVDTGGNVEFVSAPASGVTVVIRRNIAQTQTTDYTANDPFPAESHEDALDRLTFIAQQQQEELDRAIKLSRTNTMTSTEFTTSAANRANKILAFDSSGELSVTQELGSYQGTDATITTEAYVARDIVKSTTTAQLNNVYICVAVSVVGDVLTDTDHFALIVDAVSAAASEVAAEAAQAAAEAAQSAAETAETNAETAETNAAATLTTFTRQYHGAASSDPSSNLDAGDLYFKTDGSGMKVYTGSAWSDVKPTSAEQTNINTVAGLSTEVAALGASAVIIDMGLLATDAVLADMAQLANSTIIDDMIILANTTITDDMAILATDANVLAMGKLGTDANVLAQGKLGTDANVLAQGKLGTDANVLAQGKLGLDAVIEDMGILGTSANVTAMSNVSDAITNVNTVATNIASVNNFADVYRIASSAPSASLTAGDLYFNTSTNVLNVYGDSGWQNAGSSVNGTSQRYHYDIGSAVTSVTGSDASSNTLAYDAGYVDVYVNGVRMSTADVTVTSGDTVTFAEALASGDEVDIVAYGTFAVASLNADNLDSGTVPSARVAGSYTGITGTGALNAGSITSGFGAIDNGASAITTTGAISGGTLGLTGVLTANGGAVFNEGGADVDFRVESDTVTHALFVDGATGDVGIGVSNPSDYYSSNLVVTGIAEGGITIAATATNITNYLSFADASSGVARYAGMIEYDHTNNAMTFRTSSTQQMKIDSSGNVLVGTTSSANPPTQGISSFPASNSQLAIGHATGTAGGQYYVVIGYNGSAIGGITQSGTTGVAYNTSSDYRLKENVVTEWDATTRLKQLKPSRFNFIVDADTTVDGFLAHEVQAIVPEAITGTKDAVDADGNAVMQGIDQSKLVPLLVKTIQELEARITALEGA
jgi:hypothetical protein